ncbi:MAG: hypothetical protein PVF22_04540 [Candidatus Aminicenantes bacterium]
MAQAPSWIRLPQDNLEKRALYLFISQKVGAVDVAMHLDGPAVKSTSGKVLRTRTGMKRDGINHTMWNMRRILSKEEAAQMTKQKAIYRGARGVMILPGKYLVTLEIGETKLTQKARLIGKHEG